jgi:hypothetical protein
MPPEAGFSFSGISVTNASGVSMSAEIEAAFSSAARVSFGRIDDASLRQVLVFAGSYVEPFIPAAFLDYLDDQSAFLAGVVGELPCLEIDSVPTAATVPFLTSLSSERLNQHAIAERFHIDCHMFCITPGSGIQCCA